jgi:FkbM family methyltransferase
VSIDPRENIRPFGGWQVPAGEQHLIEWMAKHNVRAGGRLTYQYEKLMLALKHTTGRRTAVDIGSHVGQMSFHLASIFNRVEAFEPVPEHRECFRRNVTAENVVLHPVALGSAAGSATMVLYPNCTMHAHITASAVDRHPDAKTAQGSVDVPVAMLDGFELNEVDFVKIDVEGFELEVLNGAVKTLERWRPTIIIEQKPNNGSRYGLDDRAALPWLEARGAKMVAQKFGDYLFVWR